MTDFYAVLWGDLQLLKRRLWRILGTSLLSPALYLVAFGWGLGRGVRMDGTDYLHFVVPGIVALTAMNASFNGAGQKLNTGRLFYRTFDECLMAPVGTISIVLGKAFFGVVRGLISSMAILGGALLMAPSFVPDPVFIVTLLITCFAFASLGVLAALLAKSHEDMSTFGSFILLPMTFLGGTFFSPSSMPAAAQAVIYALPLTNSSQCLRAAVLQQEFPWLSLLAITAYGLVFFVGCILAVERSSV